MGSQPQLIWLIKGTNKEKVQPGCQYQIAKSMEITNEFANWFRNPFPNPESNSKLSTATQIPNYDLGGTIEKENWDVLLATRRPAATPARQRPRRGDASGRAATSRLTAAATTSSSSDGSSPCWEDQRKALVRGNRRET